MDSRQTANRILVSLDDDGDEQTVMSVHLKPLDSKKTLLRLAEQKSERKGYREFTRED